MNKVTNIDIINYIILEWNQVKLSGKSSKEKPIPYCENCTYKLIHTKNDTNKIIINNGFMITEYSFNNDSNLYIFLLGLVK